MHPCMHAYIHRYVHTYIHTYTHTYILLYIHTYIHIDLHTYIHTSIHTYIHTYIHTRNRSRMQTHNRPKLYEVQPYAVHLYLYTRTHAYPFELFSLVAKEGIGPTIFVHMCWILRHVSVYKTPGRYPWGPNFGGTWRCESRRISSDSCYATPQTQTPNSRFRGPRSLGRKHSNLDI